MAALPAPGLSDERRNVPRRDSVWCSPGSGGRFMLLVAAEGGGKGMAEQCIEESLTPLNLKIMVYPGGILVWIDSPFDINLSLDEVAAQVKEAWERIIIPIQRSEIDKKIAAAHGLSGFSGEGTELIGEDASAKGSF